MEKSSTDELTVAQNKDEAAEMPQKEHGSAQGQAEKQLHDFLNNEGHDEGGESGEVS